MLSKGVLASVEGAFGLMDIPMEKRCLVHVELDIDIDVGISATKKLLGELIHVL